MRCFIHVLKNTCKDHVTIEEVRNKIQGAIGKHDHLLSIVKKRKLRWHCNLKRHWHGEDNAAKNSKRNKKKRKTEKEVGK